ncbi:AraC family transcriptional regulator [Geothrix sp. 21YS21S-4]|uniref:AraC family transcriptional regulator n=1 Tax=Geothrix sp. 21YS21S-4 TaxID=3068889 RepID=UPI0027B9EFFF|nr:AraC family transcriptional regulator [Geothrix sp. 21YS21S-4]
MVSEELVKLAAAAAPEAGTRPTAIPGLQVIRSDGPTLPVPTVYTPSFCFVAQGEKVATVGGTSFRFRAGESLVVPVDVPVTGQVVRASSRRPFLCLVLDLDPDVVYRLLQQWESLPARPPAGEHLVPARCDAEVGDALLRLLRCLVQEADRIVLAPLVIQEITYRLLHSPQGAAVRQLGVAGSHVRRIAKLIEHIRSHFDRPLRMEELARSANMSPSAFFHHFKQATTMSPLRYQKELRLQEARRLLSTEVVDAATAAFRVGYESPSQFSREYARLFGLPPIADMKRLRG